MAGPITMPEDATPISARSNKAKALYQLSKWEQEQQSAHISISISKRIIDGKVKMVATMSRDNMGSLPVEYTDMGKFKTLVGETVNGVVGELEGLSGD